MMYLLLTFNRPNMAEFHRITQHRFVAYAFTHEFSGGINEDIPLCCLLLIRPDNNVTDAKLAGQKILQQVPEQLHALAENIAAVRVGIVSDYGTTLKGKFNDLLYDAHKIMDEFPPFLSGKVL